MRQRIFSIAKPLPLTRVYKPMRIQAASYLLITAALVSAQVPTAPVLSPRGVVNAYTRQPAPSPVAPGGIIWINGINLGPADGWTAEPGTPLPLAALDPAIEVRIGQRRIPLYSINPSRIVAQIPFDTPQGVTQVVVRRGEQQSAPARFLVVAPSPSIAATEGFGPAGSLSDNLLTLRAAGLGQTSPPTPPGELPLADDSATPRIPVRAYVGGMPAPASARLSADKPGEFEIKLELPPTAADGDVVNVYSGNNAGNRVTLNALAAPALEFIPLPENTANLRALTASDLRPGFLTLTGPRAEDGCYPAILVDFSSKTADPIPGCPTTAAVQAPTPFTPAADGNAIAALEGPADGDAASGISASLSLLQPGVPARAVELPGKASAIGSAPGGNFTAVLPGTPVRLAIVDPNSGEVTEGAAGPGGGGIPGGGGGGGGVNPGALQIDLGDNVKELVTAPIGLGQNQQAVIAVDSLTTVSRAKFGIVNAQGETLRAVEFPEGWLPLLAPTQAAPVQGGGGGGGGQNPGGQPPGGQNPGGQIPGGQLPNGGAAIANRFRANAQLDAPTRQFYVLARATSGTSDAYIRFPLVENQNPEVLPFSEGTFAASCTSPIRTFTLELARRAAVPTTPTPETLLRTNCGASSFATLDFASREINQISLPGQGQFNITGNAANDVNDYVYGTNTDPAQQGRSDTLYVFDGVTRSAFRLDLPPEVSSFANVTAYAPMGILYAQATANTVGDAGIVVFDLENASARLLPTPAGFTSVQPLTLFPATRKLIARGARTDPAGTQLLIYDLVSGDLQIVANPEGVAFVGALPNLPPQGGRPSPQQPALQHLNPKSNAVTMVGFSEQRRPLGVILLRVH